MLLIINFDGDSSINALSYLNRVEDIEFIQRNFNRFSLRSSVVHAVEISREFQFASILTFWAVFNVEIVKTNQWSTSYGVRRRGFLHHIGNLVVRLPIDLFRQISLEMDGKFKLNFESSSPIFQLCLQWVQNIPIDRELKNLWKIECTLPQSLV